MGAPKSHTIPQMGYVGGRKPIGFFDQESTVFIFQQVAWGDMQASQAMHLLAVNYDTFHFHYHRLLKKRNITRDRPARTENLRRKLTRLELEGLASETGNPLEKLENQIEEAARHGGDSPNSFLYPVCGRCGYRHA